MTNSRVPHSRSAPVDIVGIPEPQLREHLEHVLAQDSTHAAEPQTLLGLAQHLAGDDHPIALDHDTDAVDGHEDMLPQLRLVDALLGKNNGGAPQQMRRPFAELIGAEQHRRQRRKRISRRTDDIDTLPPPSPQAENDRLLLEEIGRQPVHRAGGWTAESPADTPAPSPVVDSPAPSNFSTGDEVMDAFVAPPDVEPQDDKAPESTPPIALKVRRKVSPAPQSVTEPPPAPAAKPPVKLKVKGKLRPAAAEPPQPPAAPPEAATGAKTPVTLKLKGKPRRAEMPPPPAPVTAETVPTVDAEKTVKPAVTMKVKGKPRRQPPPTEVIPEAVAVEAAPVPEPQPEPQEAAKPAVKMKVKGKPRRQPPPTEVIPEASAVEAAPIPEPQPEPQETAKPAITMKVKGKPRRQPPQAEAIPEAAAVEAAPIPEPQPEPQEAAKPAVSMKVKGKPCRQPPQEEAPPEPAATEAVAAPPPAEPEAEAEAKPESEPIVEPEAKVATAEPVHVQVDDPLGQQIEAIIAAHARRSIANVPPRGSFDMPENREALAKLLDETQPVSDFAALDLVYACWGKSTHDCDSRALLAVAQQISRNFGLPDKLPMASTKAWKMLNNKVFAPELADRLEQVGQFIVDWQKTQRIFLILEFSEIELIEYLFEALSPADYPELLAEVMNFKVLSNRRMGLLRRFPARLRKQTQPMLPERKEEALVIQAHGKAFLQRVADPRGFAPIVDVASKMLEEVEKMMKQTANTGAPPQLGGPPGGGGGALGRIG